MINIMLRASQLPCQTLALSLALNLWLILILVCCGSFIDFKEQFENCKMTLNVNREQEYKDGSLQWTGDEKVVSSYVLSI